jgi:hypothetical protein
MPRGRAPSMWQTTMRFLRSGVTAVTSRLVLIRIGE